FRQYGYTGSDPAADKWVFLYADGAGGTIVRFDHDGTGSNPQWPNTIIDLEHVPVAGLAWASLSGSAGTGGGGGTPTPPSVSLTTTSLALAEGNSGLTAFTYL